MVRVRLDHLFNTTVKDMDRQRPLGPPRIIQRSCSSENFRASFCPSSPTVTNVRVVHRPDYYQITPTRAISRDSLPTAMLPFLQLLSLLNCGFLFRGQLVDFQPRPLPFHLWFFYGAILFRILHFLSIKHGCWTVLTYIQQFPNLFLNNRFSWFSNYEYYLLCVESK